MPRIPYVIQVWTPESVPSVREYNLLRGMDRRQFTTFLAQKKQELKSKLAARNPYTWRTVFTLLGVGTGLVLFGALIGLALESVGLVIAGLSMLPFIAAFLCTFSVLFSNDHGSIYSAHEKFWRFCWEASRTYDYPTFSAFVESKLMNKYAV